MRRSILQKGGVGIPVVIALVGGVVVLYVGYSFVGSLAAPDLTEPAPVVSQQAAAEQEAQPAKAQSFVSFDDNFFQSEGSFYFRVADGYDLDGKATYRYIKADVIADQKTFHKVPATGDLEAGKQKSVGGGTMPAFYIDSQHVYFFSGKDLRVLEGADPNSFQVLSPVYAKDGNNVYVINTSCDATGNCTGTVTVIPGADPGSFQTFHDTTVPDPDGSGQVTIDAKDKDNIYYYGTWIGPLPDPDDHSVHPETDHPVLISP
jgi:hypothetical protein